MPSVNMVVMSIADLVLIHGFAGTGRAWDPVLERLDAQTYRAVAPDLRGHGAAGAARPVSFAACAADVLAAAPAPLTLCGYSLGGRIALHAALAAPERVARLVLVATTAGIDDPGERAARRASDEELAVFADTAITRGVRRPLGRAAAVRGHRRPRPRGSGARTCCATTRRTLPRCCAGSAPDRWRRCGTASRS